MAEWACLQMFSMLSYKMNVMHPVWIALILCVCYCVMFVLSVTLNLHADPQEGDIRLEGSDNVNEGRVEVYHNGEWGTVCDDDWDNPDANVVCRQLKYSRGGAAIGSAYFGEGTGSILYDNVACTGTELRLADCSNRGIGVHNCGHGEDAGVICITLLGQFSCIQNSTTCYVRHVVIELVL